MRYAILSFLFILHLSFLKAQMIFNVNMTAMYDDNIDNNRLQITDKITSTMLDVGYLWSQEKYEVSLSYNGALNYYTKLIDRSNSSHQLLFGYTQSLDEEDLTSLDINLGISARIDRDIFKLYDHLIYHGTAGIQHYLSDASILDVNYLYQCVRFKNLSDFNHAEYNISGQLSVSFETRTSLIFRSDFGIKIYSAQTYSTINRTSGGGYGQGPGSQTTTTTTTESYSPTVNQLSGMLRLAQSIFDKTGISITAQYQHNLKKESRYFTSNYGPIPDDVIFDDHYGYEGLLLSAMLTQILPYDTRFRLTISSQNRSYSTLPAYDLFWNQVSDKRNDKRTVYTLQLKKSIESIGLSIGATYDYIINSSNDAFYDYTNKALTFELSLLL